MSKNLFEVFAEELADQARKGVARAGAKVARHVQKEIGAVAKGLENEAECNCTPGSYVTTDGQGRRVARLSHVPTCPAWTPPKVGP